MRDLATGSLLQHDGAVWASLRLPRLHAHQAAQSLCPELEACYELSIGNADKGLLGVEEVARRARQFEQARLPLVCTQVWSACRPGLVVSLVQGPRMEMVQGMGLQGETST